LLAETRHKEREAANHPGAAVDPLLLTPSTGPFSKKAHVEADVDDLLRKAADMLFCRFSAALQLHAAGQGFLQPFLHLPMSWWSQPPMSW
jgi:hypothetical protein